MSKVTEPGEDIITAKVAGRTVILAGLTITSRSLEGVISDLRHQLREALEAEPEEQEQPS